MFLNMFPRLISSIQHIRLQKGLLTKLNTSWQLHGRYINSASFSVEPVPDFHIGIYSTVVKPLLNCQSNNIDTLVCLSDIEALSNGNSKDTIRQNILSTLSILIACGVDVNKVNIYLESKVPQYSQLAWVIYCCITKDSPQDILQSRGIKSFRDMRLSHYLQPINSGCNFFLSKSNLNFSTNSSPDSLKVLQLLTDILNEKMGSYFTPPSMTQLDQSHCEIYNLKNPSKIMDFKDSNSKTRIHLLDNPKSILTNMKKALTDFDSNVYYDKVERPGVSNLMTIHKLVSGKSFATITEESKDVNTAKYKLIVAESVNQFFEPIKQKYSEVIKEEDYLCSIIESGSLRARAIAESTLRDVYTSIGFNSESVLNTSSIPSGYITSSESSNKKQIFSGIQPTGVLHLGNYFGAVKQWIDLSKENNDIIISVVDQHAITIPQDKDTLQSSIVLMAASLIACGVEPDECILFQQSRVCEHAQLYGVLSHVVTMATLERQAQFKEKKSMGNKPSLGLFSYPVLQAADILLYKTTHVPVGEDQIQHIELARDICIKFNKLYGETFVLPEAIILNNAAARLKSLSTPTKKMSKSEKNPYSRIEILDSPEIIRSKINETFIETLGPLSYDPKLQPGISNLMTIHSVVSGDSIEKISDEIRGMDVHRYKEMVSDALISHLDPIRTKLNKLMQDETELYLTLEDGAKKAKARAEKSLSEIYEKLNFM